MSAIDVKQSKKQFLNKNKDVATSYAWIHYACATEDDLMFKNELVNQLVDALQTMMKTFEEFDINKKSYIQTFVKTMRLLIENVSVNWHEGPVYEEIKEELDEIIGRVVKFFFEVENNVGGFETFCEGIKQDAEDKSFVSAIAQESFKQKMSDMHKIIYDLLKPSDKNGSKIVTPAKSKSQSNSIQKYIEENFDEFCNTITKTRGGIANAVSSMLDDAKNDSIDILNEIQNAIGGLFAAVRSWEGKVSTTGIAKIRDALTKLLSLMRKADDSDKALKFFDKMPEDFITIINDINDSAKVVKKVTNGKTSTPGDPWTRKVRIAKRKPADASGGDTADGTPAKKGKSLKDMDTKTKYREAHKTLYPTYDKFVSKVDLELAHKVASDFAKKFANDLFEELNFPKESRKHLIKHLPFNDTFESINEDDVKDPKYDTYYSAHGIITSLFEKDKDILMQTDYALCIGNGFYGENGNRILICVWINASDPQNPVAVNVSPVKISIDDEKKVKIVPVSQLIRQANAKVIKNGSLPLAPVTPKRRESKPKKTVTDDAELFEEKEEVHVPEVSIFDKHLEMHGKSIKFARIDPLMDQKALGERLNQNIGEFVKKHLSHYGKDRNKGYCLFVGRLITAAGLINEKIDQSQICGVVSKPSRLIEFVKEPGQGLLYLYPSTMYIMRRFDTNVEQPSVASKIYQIYVVYSDVGEGVVVNTPDGKNKYGYFGFIESPNVFRVIRDFADLDSVNQTLIKAKYPLEDLPKKEHKKLDHKSDESPYAMSEPDTWEVVDARVVAPPKSKGMDKMMRKNTASSSKKTLDDDEDNFLGEDF